MFPSTDQASGLRVYSFGIVVEDKQDDGDYIKVVPIEELPLVKGKLSEAKFDKQAEGTDHKGVTVKADAKGVAFVVAQWTPIDNGNRNTAPNVSKGETVLLLKFGSTNELFWCDFFREPKLRRLENVIYAYSNVKDPGQEYDQDSSYWFQISTRDKVIRLHTSNNDGEKVTYDVVFDTANGKFTIADSNKNFLEWDSVNSNLKIAFNNLIQFTSQMIEINGKKYVRTAGQEITETAESITNKSSQSYKVDSAGSAEIKASSPVKIKPAVSVGS